MSVIGAIVIFVVALVGLALHTAMRAENVRTRPARVRQRLKDLGLTDEQIDRAHPPAPSPSRDIG